MKLPFQKLGAPPEAQAIGLLYFDGKSVKKPSEYSRFFP
jgi:hypothetical protein